MLRLRDPRRFGAVLWFAGPAEQHPLLQHLGPEPLQDEFTAGYLKTAFSRRKSAVKTALMDNKIVVGVGNIYANEALFAAGILPTRRADRVSAEECRRLVAEIRSVLQRALKAGGSSLRDFLHSDGQSGYFQQQYQVYGREGEPCHQCGTPIARQTIGQRSSFYCPTTQRTTRRTLVRVLETILRLLHPIMPFITEELWQVVAPLANAKTADSIMLAAYPKADPEKIVQAAFDQMAQLQDLIGAVRNLRGEMGIAPNVKAPLFVEGSAELEGLLKYLPSLTRLTEAKLVDSLPEAEDAPVAVCNGARLMLKVEIDKAAETARLSKEAEKLQKALDKLNAKLSKPGYTEKAPAHLVEKDKADLAELEDKMAKVQTQLAKLKD